jgi:hypothetical protein
MKCTCPNTRRIQFIFNLEFSARFHIFCRLEFGWRMIGTGMAMGLFLGGRVTRARTIGGVNRPLGGTLM